MPKPPRRLSGFTVETPNIIDTLGMFGTSLVSGISSVPYNVLDDVILAETENVRQLVDGIFPGRLGVDLKLVRSVYWNLPLTTRQVSMQWNLKTI